MGTQALNATISMQELVFADLGFFGNSKHPQHPKNRGLFPVSMGRIPGGNAQNAMISSQECLFEDLFFVVGSSKHTQTPKTKNR